MLERDGGAELIERRQGSAEIEPALEVGVDTTELEAAFRDGIVEDEVLAAVHGFLGEERPDLLAELRLDGVPIAPDCVHEKALPLRKRSGERVEEGGGDRVAQPASRRRGPTPEGKVARVNGQIDRRLRFGHERVFLPLVDLN